MTIERDADAILRSGWPGYRPAPLDYTGLEVWPPEWGHNRPHLADLTPAPDGAWETYAVQSARLAQIERREKLWISAKIALAMAVLTAGSFALGVWWAVS